MGTTTGVGARLKCEKCASEAIVITGSELDLSCCGTAMKTLFAATAKKTDGDDR